MMGGKTPETCQAVNKRQDNKLKNCCIRWKKEEWEEKETEERRYNEVKKKLNICTALYTVIFVVTVRNGTVYRQFDYFNYYYYKFGLRKHRSYL
jgi:hypothetical protein